MDGGSDYSGKWWLVYSVFSLYFVALLYSLFSLVMKYSVAFKKKKKIKSTNISLSSIWMTQDLSIELHTKVSKEQPALASTLPIPLLEAWVNLSNSRAVASSKGSVHVTLGRLLSLTF